MKQGRKMKRFARQFIALVLILPLVILVGISSSQAGVREENTDRPGSDLYPGTTISSVDACEQKCMQDPKCKAWTYVKPGVQGPEAKCWLKSSVPPAKTSECCVSGYKGELATMQIAEISPHMITVIQEIMRNEQAASGATQPNSQSGDLAIIDWCFYANPIQSEISLFPLVKNVGNSTWASAKSGSWIVGATYYYGVFSLSTEQKHTLPSYAGWWLKPGEISSMWSGLKIEYGEGINYTSFTFRLDHEQGTPIPWSPAITPKPLILLVGPPGLEPGTKGL
jgi:hypothetical protein